MGELTKTADDVQSDGVIVGSAFVKAVLANPEDPLPGVRAVAEDLARGVRNR